MVTSEVLISGPDDREGEEEVEEESSDVVKQFWKKMMDALRYGQRVRPSGSGCVQALG